MSNTVASYEAGRQLLARAQSEVAAGQLERAADAFASAVQCFSGPVALLGGGHAWRGLAEIAISRALWDRALEALDAAESLFELGIGQQRSLDGNTDIERQLNEGLLLCGVSRAEVALRQEELDQARRWLNEAAAYWPGSGVSGRVSLWRLAARLSEREGRWNTARMEWTRVARMAQEAGEPHGRTDALVRLAEVLVLMNRPNDAEDALTEADEAARRTMEAPLLGRVQMARASLLERRGEDQSSWEMWESALEALSAADSTLQGLARVRLSLLAARIRPLEASFLLKEGLRHLTDSGHPDALGLIHHQLALVASELGNVPVAALAAKGAEVARGHRGIATQSILDRALDTLGEGGTLQDLARGEGLIGTPLGSRRSAIELCDRLGAKTNTPRPASARDLRPGPKMVWSEGDQVHEQSLSDGLVTLGPDADADIQVSASGAHVAIRRDASGVRVRVDPFSPQPVLLDGHAIRGEHFLTDGDVLTLGDLELRHVLPPPTRPTPPRPATPAPERLAEEPAPPPLLAPPAPQPRGAAKLYGLVFVVSTGLISGLLGALMASILMLIFAAM